MQTRIDLDIRHGGKIPYAGQQYMDIVLCPQTSPTRIHPTPPTLAPTLRPTPATPTEKRLARSRRFRTASTLPSPTDSIFTRQPMSTSIQLGEKVLGATWKNSRCHGQNGLGRLVVNSPAEWMAPKKSKLFVYH